MKITKVYYVKTFFINISITICHECQIVIYIQYFTTYFIESELLDQVVKDESVRGLKDESTEFRGITD